MKFNIKKSIDVKLNVRPVMVDLVHEYVFEGPCRFRKGEELKREFDIKSYEAMFNQFVETINKSLSVKYFNILEPKHISWDESFIIDEAQINDLAEDIENVDVYLIQAPGVGDFLMEFAVRFKKPMIILGFCINTGTTAGLLARGLDTYPCETMTDAVETMKLMRVKKALSESRVLGFTRLNSNNAPGMIDSFICLNEVTKKLGVRFRYFNIHEFMEQTHNVPNDSNSTTPGKRESNINDEDEKEINRMLDELIGGSAENHMKREDMFPSMRAYYLINKLLEKTGCNAFTAPCFDICASRRFNEERFTFCLSHSLNNENGISSACEYDMCALISMIVLSNVADAPAYMGNTIPNIIEAGWMRSMTEHGLGLLSTESVNAVEKEVQGMDNLVFTFHAVPNRKLRGFDSEMAPYGIQSFAHSGWGATIRYDFAKDKGQTITMCRFDPTCSKLFVARGTVVSGIGYRDKNCSEGVIFQVNDSKDFFNKISIVGNHNPLVYGDYFDQVVKLGKMLKLDVIVS
ncbi:MAG: hypothetical protein JW927_08780 [Deltaproteobacteria bacterium]|nr:hypothetical protein [Deltaproteobacteria bacterium]